jgi:CRP/FNR family transcriptional regulator, cyclic AMP receptor protein
MDESHLRELPLFAGLSRRQLAKILPHTRLVEIASGEHLVREGDFAYDFFVIERGRAAVIAGGRHIADLGPGDFLGEIGLVRQRVRTASVIAMGAVEALVIDAEGFRRMSRSMPTVAAQINAAIEDRLTRDRLFGLERD